LFVLQIVITKFPWQCKVPLQIKAFHLHITSDQGMFHGQLPVFSSPRLTGKKYTLHLMLLLLVVVSMMEVVSTFNLFLVLLYL